MKKTIRKFIILGVVFILALVAYFILSQRKGNNDIAYTAIEDADLPVVYMQMFGKNMNRLYGFVEDKPESAGRSTLTLLPDDRNLNVSFQNVTTKVTGIQYEIRSLDGQRLVERTVLQEWSQADNTIDAVLPIQNLLTKDEEYKMTLTIATEEHPAVYYYTRIVWSDNAYIQEMVNLAENFSSKTMNYNDAKELTTYLETDASADNSSLGQVTLKNSFSQLTWHGLSMEREGEVLVNLKEMQGLMGNIQISYIASRRRDDGSKDYFDVTESFTMKWNAQRIYMMDYDRRTNQVFSGDESLYTDKQIMLGISDTGELQQMSDSTGKYKAFVANRALWCYDKEKESSTKVFAFRKSEADLQASFDHHGVKILSVSDSGVIDFLVYGYMNRGNHEGTTGVSVYRYESSNNTLTERLFLPADEDYWSLRQDLNNLSYLSSSQVLYILMNHTVYGVDLTSKEYMVVADGLTQDNFAASSDLSHIAWQVGNNPYDSEILHVLNLQSGNKNEIHPPEGDVISLIGFVGNDLVYGLAKQGDKLMANGRAVGMPMYALEIVGDDKTVQTRYEKPGILLTDVSIKDSRVHLMKMIQSESGYTKTEADTLVCNEQVTPDPLAGLGYVAAEEEGRLYFVQLDAVDSKTQNVKLHVPKKVVAEENNVLTLQANNGLKAKNYYAYSSGRMNGSFADFADAVNAAYDGMGLVTNQSGRVLWTRANRANSRVIKDVQSYVPLINRYMDNLSNGVKIADDGVEIIDAKGCTLSQVLYFVHAGYPVEAYLGGGGQAIIYGYDQYNISCLWYPGTEMAYADKMGLNDAAAFFQTNGENDFVCFYRGN